MYVLISKSQLNSDINNKVNFRKMQIPFFALYSKFSFVVTRIQNLRFYGTLWKGIFTKFHLQYSSKAYSERVFITKMEDFVKIDLQSEQLILTKIIKLEVDNGRKCTFTIINPITSN